MFIWYISSRWIHFFIGRIEDQKQNKKKIDHFSKKKMYYRSFEKVIIFILYTWLRQSLTISWTKYLHK